MEHACKACGKTFSSLKAIWSHEAKNVCTFKCPSCDRHFPSLDEMKEHKKAAHRSEKWQVSPKFEKHSNSKIFVESMCREVVAELIEGCFKTVCEDNLTEPQNDTPDQATSSSVLGIWVADPSLPKGWKTCVISKGDRQPGGSSLPEKRMFYSPGGKLFTNRLALDRFLGEQKKVAEKEGSKEDAKLGNLADLCMPKMEAPDSEEEVSDAISLSDEDFEDFKQPQHKRKHRDDEPGKNCRKSKKPKLDSPEEHKYPTLTPAQEKILIGCYEEWPVPFPGLVEQLQKDTGLPAGRIEDWFGRRTDNCLRRIFGSVV
eukprot:GFUD01041610.1.p1 GENE.GFUD01041610.1~~GFUD01041610.1.p1  ORF type:complete len:315 (-),score=80.73 GFUD01041610.1:66-1010(-)